MEPLEPRTLLAVTGLPKQIGSSGFDMGNRIVGTPDGGYVVAGIFSGTVNFNPSGTTRLTARGDTDIYIAKYSASSKLVWVKQFGGIEYTEEIADEDFIDFAADPLRAGGLFVHGVGSDPVLAAEYATDLAVGADGSVFVTGDFLGAVDFDPGHGRKILTTFDNDFYDGFILKLNSNGGLNFVRQIGDRFTDTVSSIAFDSSNNIFVTGLFSRDVNFVPGKLRFLRHADGRADGYVMKMSPTGTVIWVDQFGSDATKKPELDAGNDIAVDSSGNVFVGGTYTGDATFTSTNGKSIILDGEKRSDGVVAKYSNDGVVLRTAGFLGKGYDGIRNVALDSAGKLIVTGYYQGDSFDANPGPLTVFLPQTIDNDGNESDLTDVFIERLDPNNFQVDWIDRIAGTGTEFADQVKTDNAGNIYISGSFYGKAQFGRGGVQIVSSVEGVEDFDDPNNNDRDESYDAYLLKLDSAGARVWVRTIGSASDDFGAGLDLASNGSVIFTGRFRGTVDFDTRGDRQRRLSGAGLADAFVTGFDEDGTPLF
jgi:hypothetical protein